MNIEIAYKIERMKKEGASDRQIGEALGLSERAILYTRQALEIHSRQRFRAYDQKGMLVAEGTAREIGRALSYSSSAVRKWPGLNNPPYRVEMV